MTPNKVIESVDSKKPNAYDEEIKFGWINNLDGMVKRLVHQEKEITPYVYPNDMDKELLIPYPFDDVYGLYVEAMIDYYNKEYSNYNNTAMMFESRYSEYKKDYIRNNKARG